MACQACILVSLQMVFIEPIGDDDDDKRITIVKLLDEKYDQLSQLDTTWKLPINDEHFVDTDDEVEKLL